MSTDELYRDISRYLSGEKVNFSHYKTDLSTLTEFQQLVLTETRNIPYGETITYSELARRIGKEKAVRAVGTALSKNPYPIIIPCHRVVAKSGGGGYRGGVELKKRLLELEARCFSITKCRKLL